MIRLKNVRKTFRSDFLRKRTEVLRGIDLNVRVGETYALLGANGAGKTTTMKILIDLIRPDEGSATIRGIPTRDPRSRSRIGYLPEHPYFPPHLTGGELVRYHARLAGLSRADASRNAGLLIDKVGMMEAESRKIRTYSKGMLQRIGFAQALTGDPELLILDEPLSGLDPFGRRELRDLMMELKEGGTTILLSSHILEDVERICDRAGFLVDGEVTGEVDGGETAWIEIRAEGVDPESLLSGAREARRIIREGEKVLISLANECDLPEVREKVDREGGTILSIEKKRESLEELFLRNVRKRDRVVTDVRGS